MTKIGLNPQNFMSIYANTGLNSGKFTISFCKPVRFRAMEYILCSREIAQLIKIGTLDMFTLAMFY